MAEALYRKYRPQTFEDVVGQEHIERTLRNALEQDKVSHAYLFCGPRGTGKTTTARLLAKALLCENGPTSTPCGVCQDCRDIAEGVHPDVYELDAASRTGVENVRDEIIGRVNYAPTRGRYKVYIIDEVHMLSTAAFNALLKTLEEPPSHVVFILCTTDPHKVPETIHSRCQRFDFHRLSNDEIVSRLGAVCVAEGVEFEPEALELAAMRAEGGMRNALTSLEQMIAFGGGVVTVAGAEDLLGSLDSSDMAEIMNALGRRDVAACFTWTAQYVESGADLAQFCGDMAQRVRNLYVMSLSGTDAALDVPDAERRELASELALFGPDRLARMMAVLGDVIAELRATTNPRLCFEIALTRMVRPESDVTLAALAERIEALEKGVSRTPFAAVQPATAAPASAPVASPAPAPMRNEVVPAAPARVLATPAAPGAPASASAAPAPAPAPALQAEPTPAAASAPAPTAAPAPAPVPEAAPVPPRKMAQPAPYEVPSSVSPAPAAPAPAPEPVQDVVALIANEAALQRMWRSVLNVVKKEKTAYGALLVGVSVQPNEYGGVSLQFPAENAFAFGMAQRPELKGVIESAFRTVAGVDIPFTVDRAGDAAPADAPQAAPAEPAPAVANARAVVAAATARAAAAPVEQAAPEAPSPAPTSAPAFVPAPQAPRPSAAAPEPYRPPADDEVPLDLYDDIVPDDEPPFDPDPRPARAAQPRQQAPAPLTAEQLGRMASDAFGSPITFEEVR